MTLDEIGDRSTSYVVATAGHVDHGKSALVAAITGMDPDRWHEEKTRGLTIDLGFAWTTLPTGENVTFVDVPGHEKFLGNTLTGLGPAPVVTFVVAADEGWSAQSADHRDAVAALGIALGVVVITKTDRAPDRVCAVAEQARHELSDTGLSHAPVVAVSALRGTGLDDYRRTLSKVLRSASAGGVRGRAEVGEDRVRLWVDRSFTINGAGTVVTATLNTGALVTGDTLQLVSAGAAPRLVTIRGLQSRGQSVASLTGVDRVAANLRGLRSADVSRGDVLLTPDSWHLSSVVEVRRTTGASLAQAPREIQVHVGTSNQQVHVRAFDADHARLTFERPIPLAIGDALLLRDTGSRRIFGGCSVLDPDPPELRRRGDGKRRSDQLRAMNTTGDVLDVLTRRGAVTREFLRRRGYLLSEVNSIEPALRVGEWLLSTSAYAEWTMRLQAMVVRSRAHGSLAGGLPVATARQELGKTAAKFLDALITDAGLEVVNGVLRPAGVTHDLGECENSIRELEARLEQAPFSAPQADELALLGLQPHHLAAAERSGRLLRLSGGVVVLPSAPARAMTYLAGLPQPFTTSSARQALGTSRRVVVPLLEYLDRRGLTRRVNDVTREVMP